MSNRIVAFLTLLVFAIIGVIASWWYLYAGTSALSITVKGPENSTVSLLKAGQIMLTTPCNQTGCTIDRIPPFSYTLEVSASGYMSYTEAIDIRSNQNVTKNVMLKKDYKVSDFRTQNTKDAVASARTRKMVESSGGLIIGSTGSGVFFLQKSKAGLYDLKKQLGDAIVKLTSLKTSSEPKVFSWNENDALAIIESGNEKMLFDANSGMSYALNKDTEVRHVNRYNDTYIITSDSGALFGEIRQDGLKLSIHPFYDDILPLSSGDVLGLVRNTSTKKKALLSLSHENADTIFLDKKVGGREIIMQVSDAVSYFEKKEGSVLFVTSTGERKVIENIYP